MHKLRLDDLRVESFAMGAGGVMGYGYTAGGACRPTGREAHTCRTQDYHAGCRTYACVSIDASECCDSFGC